MGRFRDALSGPGLAGIAEIKRRSPSAGDLRPDADPATLATTIVEFGRKSEVFCDPRNGIIHLDETRALEPLERTSEWDRGELPETYPSGV